MCVIIIKPNELLSSNGPLDDESMVPCGPSNHGITL